MQIELAQTGRTLTRCTGALQFQDVTFAYPTRVASPVLNGVSFSVAAGKICAIVGASGAGKSTVFHLLQHFYEPSSGRITLDGENLSELDHGWLHRNLAIVGQVSELYYP